MLGPLPQYSCGVCGGRALAPPFFCICFVFYPKLPQHSCGVCGGRALAPFAFMLGLLLQDSCGVCGSRAWRWTFFFLDPNLVTVIDILFLVLSRSSRRAPATSLTFSWARWPKRRKEPALGIRFQHGVETQLNGDPLRRR